MRYPYLRAALVLLALGACSGGDSLTTPTGDATATLTVAGVGAGSAHVASALGVDPAVSCDLAGAAATGTCSTTYPVGTVVQLTITPGTGATFTGWTGDAASCGTATSCSVTMSTNQAVTARLSGGTAGPAGVQVVSSALFSDPDLESVTWAVEVSNTTTQLVEAADVEVTIRDASGGMLDTTSITIGPIPPGETRADQGFADFAGTETTAEARITDFRLGSGDGNLGAAEIVASNWQPGAAADGFAPWTVQLRNTSGRQLESVEVGISTHDAAGKIVAASFTFVGPIPPGGTELSDGLIDYHGTEASAEFQVISVE